ncbi:MAG: NADPH-dependent F420 reductase [Candidatus Thorarchaeota archaeon]
MKKISIVGVGTVGATLGRLWAEKGHVIQYGLRDEQNPKFLKLKKDYPFKIHGRPVGEVREFSDLIVLAVPYHSLEELVPLLGDLTNKTIIDCINPILPQLAGLSVGGNNSAAEEIARFFPGAHVVKAFNSIGMNNLEDLDFNGVTADAFICGDDPAAKKLVGELASDLGFSVIDAGDLKMARYLEPLALLWIKLANKYGRQIAFKLLRREKL